MKGRSWQSAVIYEMVKASFTAQINKREQTMNIMVGGDRICAKDRATATTIMKIYTLVNGRLINVMGKVKYLLENKIVIRAVGNMT